MNLSEAEKRMIYQVEGTSQGAALNEIYMTWRYAPDKSSGRRLQEIEIIYNHIGEFDHSKVTLWKGNAV